MLLVLQRSNVSNIQMDVKRLWHIKIVPAADNEGWGEFTCALIASIRRTVGNIFQPADATRLQRFENLDWVDGWQTPPHKALHRAISKRFPDTAASSTQVINGFMSALDADSPAGLSGPDLLRTFRRRLIGYSDCSTQASSFCWISSSVQDPRV